ncbi:phage major capsid protein, P2 family [Sphingomonas sp. RS6]
MQNQTRVLFNSYLGQIAKLNSLDGNFFSGTSTEIKKFAVAPAIEQRLQAKLQETSDFLSRINVVPVIPQIGDRVGVGVTRTLAGRTNTAAGQRRTPTNPFGSDAIDQYVAKQTNYDYAWPYGLLDAWAHRPEFQQLCRDAVIVQKAQDIITIGFNGVDAQAQTDRVAYPLLQDVNYGWLYKMRTYAPSRVMPHGGLDQAKVYVSETGAADYANLDALVFDVIHNLLHAQFQGATDLVVIVGRDLVHEKYFKIVSEAGNTATEMVARDVLLSSRQLGGKPTMQVPNFPADALMVTSLKNLSYYWQVGSNRRNIVEESALDQIANYESVNDAFMVEEYGKAALVENIQLGPKV